jgi:hypothetical protein
VLFKLFFASYSFNEKKSNSLEKILCYEKLQKFEQHFELVSRIVNLNLLTRKSTHKNNTEVAQIF